LSGLLVLWVGANLVYKGELTLGQLIAFRILAGYVTSPLLRMATLWQSFQETNLSLERLSDIVDHPEEIEIAGEQLPPMPPIQGAISLRILICGPVVNQAYLREITVLNQNISGLQLQIQTGQLSQDSYLDLLQEADLFVMPSRLEGTSPAALEALWMGVPAILSPQCGVDHFRADAHGRLIDPNTPENLAGILADILSHPQHLSDWRHQLEQDRGLYSWDSYFEGMEKGVADIKKGWRT
jgi:glycosyltransferase involved in cell wall biosynthesis